MTLQQLKYIIKVVECGSINEAAKQLFITQPSLSTAIKELEKEYNIEIFNRSSKGITLSSDGTEFLSYARQILEQAALLEQRYKNKAPSKRTFSVSTQHYAFCVNAFVQLIEESSTQEYEFTLRETRTHDIMEDVQTLRSELGILYLNEFNEKVLLKLLKEKQLLFHPLFNSNAHVFVSKKNPLAKQDIVTLEHLEEYPCLSFEQGEFNSFYFSEEILSTVPHKKSIRVSDRATLFNLLIGLNGYTISSGVLSSDLNDNNLTAVPLKTDEYMCIGWIENRKAPAGKYAKRYIELLKRYIEEYGFTIIN